MKRALLFVTSCLIVFSSLLATQASAAPVTGLASSTALPTAQVTGIVRATVTVGDTVYATGKFTKARPAGVAAGGAGEISRGNLVAFSISTGKLTGFSHALNGEGKAITVSADGTKLFVGGKFTTVDGVTRNHLAAFSLPSGALLPTYVPGPVYGTGTGTVLALAAAKDGRLYVGGGFSQVGSSGRANLAAYTPSGLLDATFKPAANAQVAALVVTPDGSKLVAGGSFSTLAGVPAPGLGAVVTVTGAPVPTWATASADFPIRNDDTLHSARGVTSLATDGEKVYGSAFNYINAVVQGSWEGTFALDPNNGNLLWGNNCHGDTYDVFPTRGALYSVSHAHDCTAVGVWPETSPTSWHRAMASTTTVDGVNVCGNPPYACYAGMPRSTILTAYAPVLNTGTYSGAGQAAWTVTGNNNYVVLGGEFTKVNGQNQQGLTRMAIQ